MIPKSQCLVIHGYSFNRKFLQPTVDPNDPQGSDLCDIEIITNYDFLNYFGEK